MVYHTKFEKWDYLPTELKMECIKKMTLKTRYRLRGTCSTERKLVDMTKFNLSFVEISQIFSEKIDFDYKLSDWKGRSDLEVNMENVQETLVPFLGFVFRIANVKRLVNHITPEESKIFSQIDSSSLRINDIYGELPLELLRKCEGLQDLYGCFRGKLSELLSLPSISSVKWFTLQISNMSAEDFLQIAEKFIELDVNIGSRVEDQVYTKTLRIKPFVTAFANLEILNQTDRLIRMGTRNPAKHMLFYIHEELEVRMIVMIPSDIEETDYERCLRM